MRIVITEAQLKRILENKDSEYLPDDFFEDVKKFVVDLKSNPASEIPERLKNQGVNRQKLIDALLDVKLITRKQRPKEITRDGKTTSKMLTKFSFNLDNGTEKIEKARKSLFESKDDEEIMDEETLFEIETDEVDEAMAAGASNGAGGTWMGDASYTAPVKLGKKKDPAYDHTDIVRKSFNSYNPKTEKIK